jgi:biofilm PGA synthesis N-glycosyltransferase PgaC
VSIARSISSGTAYVLIVAARDEEKHIANLIESVLAQTMLPHAFVIVSDGSRDRTDMIVESYTSKHGFISLLRHQGQGKANFGSKALAIRAGVRLLETSTTFEYLGVLDADITFEAQYFEMLISRLKDRPGIGIGGGVINELRHGRWLPLRYNYGMSVAGAVQMFRRQCYKTVGGYKPIASGGIDTVAESMARMYGWEVKTFPELNVYHHRPVGTWAGGALRAIFRAGMQEYANGYSSIFQIARAFYRITEKPFVIGSLARLCGYYYSFIKRDKVIIPDSLVLYLKREQYRQLSMVLGKISKSASRRLFQ